jgi:hypothetical protein
VRHHKGAFVGCCSLRLKKNINWELLKKLKSNRNPSITDQMARNFLPFLQTNGGQVIRNHYDVITTAPPSANRCPQRYCVYDLAQAISRMIRIPFVPAFSLAFSMGSESCINSHSDFSILNAFAVDTVTLSAVFSAYSDNSFPMPGSSGTVM